MVDCVKRPASYARARRPGFLIVPQNGDELPVHPDYRAAIDAIAKEDLLVGGDGRQDGEPNAERETAANAGEAPAGEARASLYWRRIASVTDHRSARRYVDIASGGSFRSSPAGN